MTISPLALAAKKVIDAAWYRGASYDLSSQAAFALESAQLLQSPETVAESDHRYRRLRTAMLAVQRDRRELRAQVAALLAERHSTNESLSLAAEALREQRDRIAALEARLNAPSEAPIAYALTDKAEDVTPQVRKLRRLLAGQRQQAGGVQ